MSTSCEQVLEHLTAAAVQGGSWPQELEAHIERCPACSAWASRLRGHAWALGELRPLAAPAELEGRVVAAMHGGQREDRAVAELMTLGTAGAPAELDGRILSLFADLRAEGLLQPSAAPEELEQRVDADLQDLPAATTAHLLSKLPQLEAPEQLEARVEDELTLARPRRASLHLVWTRKRALAAGAAAAACLALWIGFNAGPGTVAPRAALYPFEVVVLDDSSELSPAARGMLDSVSGGALQLLEAASREPLGLGGALAAQRNGNGSSSGAGGQATSSGRQPRIGGAGSTATRSTAAAGNVGSGSVGSGNGASGQQQSASAGSLFDQVSHSLSTTALRGVRSVHLFADPGDASTEVEYLEEVATDGQGNFTILPGQVLVPNISGADLAQFQLLQGAREGFFFRSRDFDVRDVARFSQQWIVTDLALQMDVAGVTASAFDLARADGQGSRYRLAIDPQTAVILSQEELTAEGQLLSRVQFQSLAYDADLSDLALTSGTSQWLPVDLANQASLPFTLIRPTAPPTGFAFERAAMLSAAGADWVRLTYGDGVDEVFFVFDAQRPSPTSTQASIKNVGDSLRVLGFGAWTVIEGEVAGRRLMVVGKAAQDDLLLMLQSAFETL